jgi:hypothetical protein
VQASGEAVVLVGELGSGVQPRQDHLDARNALFLVDVHGHPAPVVGYRERVVLVEDHVQLVGKACDCFVDRVIDDLLGEMVGPLRLGVHTGAFPHRLQPSQNFDRGGVIRCTQ